MPTEDQACRACAARRDRGFVGQCPACANVSMLGRVIRRLTDVEEERATLRARLATVEKERDELAAERESYSHVLRERRDLQFDRDRLTAERDAAKAECERLKAVGAWKPEEVWRDEVADEVAEQIAQWLDAKAAKLEATLASIPDNKHNREQRDEFGWGASYTSGAAADIRAGKWRTP